jgi:hypothetical protein
VVFHVEVIGAVQGSQGVFGSHMRAGMRGLRTLDKVAEFRVWEE